MSKRFEIWTCYGASCVRLSTLSGVVHLLQMAYAGLALVTAVSSQHTHYEQASSSLTASTIQAELKRRPVAMIAGGFSVSWRLDSRCAVWSSGRSTKHHGHSSKRSCHGTGLNNRSMA